MPDIHGITPGALWTALGVLVALCVVFAIVWKVFDIIRTEMERNRHKREAVAPGLADEVSQKVLEKLEPRLADIETKLANDKHRIDDHERLLSGLGRSHEDVRKGLTALCRSLLVLLNHGGLDNNADEVREATKYLTAYLTERL